MGKAIGTVIDKLMDTDKGVKFCEWVVDHETQLMWISGLMVGFGIGGIWGLGRGKLVGYGLGDSVGYLRGWHEGNAFAVEQVASAIKDGVSHA